MRLFERSPRLRPRLRRRAAMATAAAASGLLVMASMASGVQAQDDPPPTTVPGETPWQTILPTTAPPPPTDAPPPTDTAPPETTPEPTPSNPTPTTAARGPVRTTRTTRAPARGGEQPPTDADATPEAPVAEQETTVTEAPPATFRSTSTAVARGGVVTQPAPTSVSTPLPAVETAGLDSTTIGLLGAIVLGTVIAAVAVALRSRSTDDDYDFDPAVVALAEAPIVPRAMPGRVDGDTTVEVDLRAVPDAAGAVAVEDADQPAGIRPRA